MKIWYVSDLHFDFITTSNRATSKLLKRYFDEYEGEMLLIAGDISHYLKQIETILNFFTEKFDHVLYVYGNHEFYNVSHRQQKRYVQTFDKINALKNLNTRAILLDGDYVEIHGIKIGGGCGWHDKSYLKEMLGDTFTDKLYLSLWKTYMNDGYKIPQLSNPEYLTEIELTKLRSLSYVDILCTHYVPSTIDRLFPLHRNDRLNTFFCFDGTFIKYDISVHGHVHGNLEIDLNDKRFYRNAIGYPNEKNPMLLKFFEV